MPIEERVLIAGAGPVGLVAAANLIRGGVPVTVFEAGPDLSEESRASTFHPPTLDMLAQFGAEPTSERVVEQGKIITAAGVSSGIDMALRLAAHIAGDEVAQAIQLGIEYDPQPPFDTGSVAKAPEKIRALTLGALAAEAGAAQSRS